MKGLSFIVFFVLLLSVPAFSEEPRSFTDSDLRQYGGGSSSSNPNTSKCVVTDYSSYNESTKRRDMAIGSSQTYGNRTYGTARVIPGRVNKTAYMTVTIMNTSESTVTISARDIAVYTIKGNTIYPINEGFIQIYAGESETLVGLKFPRGISKVVDVQINCP